MAQQFPTKSTAIRPLEAHARTTEVDVNYDPVRPWVKTHNAQAGMREHRWVRDNPSATRPYQGKWIAVLGNRVLVDRPSMHEVYDFLKSQGFADALVLKVPVETGVKRHRIAHANSRL